MQMDRVETSAGTAICAAPYRMASRCAMPFLHVALDVLDRDGRVVDQDADRQRETAQGHDVDRLAEEAQHHHRGQDRQRDRDRDDEGAAPTAEKEQDHQRGQAGGDDRLADHAEDRGLDEDRLVGERLDLQLRRQGLRDARQDLANAIDDADRGSIAGLDDADQHAAPPVLAHDIGLRREAVLTVATSRR